MSAKRLLVITQAVDLDDPVLGFFHAWIAELSKHADVQVICLRKGRHSLPANVTVHSLGKEEGMSRIQYLLRFYRYVWSLRHEYDAVFVHMNAEYVVLAGLLWRLLGKRVVLWRNHGSGGLTVRIAAWFAHAICYTSPHSFVSRYAGSVQMPVGIDVVAYTLPHSAKRGSVLALGRFDPVKKMDVLLAAMDVLDGDVHLDIYGEPTKGREMYLQDLKRRYARLEEEERVHFKGSVRHSDTPSIYAAHDIYVNLTREGSFDKTMFEAMAAGCLVVTSNAAVRPVIHPQLFVDTLTKEAVAAAIGNARDLADSERSQERKKLREYAGTHSLGALVTELVRIL